MPTRHPPRWPPVPLGAAATLAARPTPTIGFLLQFAAVGTFIGKLIAYHRRRTHSGFDTSRSSPAGPARAMRRRTLRDRRGSTVSTMRLRYLLAALAALACATGFGLVANHIGPWLQFAAGVAGILIVGAIAVPGDLTGRHTR